MSTIPFVQVEGSIALPRMRPLALIPPPFGGEWALMPPHFSLRTEIKALYAAIMRTVCLSIEEFCARCHWDTRRPFAATPAAAPVNEPSLFAGASIERGGSPTPITRANRAVRTTPASHKLAGGTCAIGGAALLAWIVASHTPHGEEKSPTPSAARASQESGNAASQRLADERAAHERAAATAATTVVPAQQPAMREATAEDSAAPVQAAASTPAANPIATTQSAARSSTRVPDRAPVPLPNYAAAELPLSPLRAPLATPAAKSAKSSAVKPATRAVRRHASHERSGLAARRTGGERVRAAQHTAHTFAPESATQPATTHRTTGMYSKAQHYSPRQPKQRHDDEYASISTSANTYTAPRPAGRASIPVDSTEWVNHVSQRRVTEIPDRFEK
jgi:hypothetical protein